MTTTVRRIPLALALAAAVLLLAAAAPTGAEPGLWQENEHSRVRLISPWAEAPAAGEVLLGLEFEVVPGWHVYWKNSGDAGYPPAISFQPTPEVTAAELLYPAPERYALPGDLVALGYEEHVVYPLRLELDATGQDGITLAADLDYLVCEVDCVPYSYRLTLDQPLAAPGAAPLPDPPRAELVEHWLARVPRPVDEVAGVESDGVLDLTDPEHPRLTVTVRGVTPAPGAEPALFLESHETFDAEPPEWAAVDGGLRFQVPLSFRQTPDQLPRQAEFAWTVTGLAPADGAGADGAAVDGAALPVEARRTVPAEGAPAARAAAPPPAPLTPAEPLPILLGVLAGALLLHLTPLVLPLTAVRLGEVGRETRSGARRAALATAAGLAAGGLAVGLAGPLAGGTTWGFQLGEPVLLAALSLLGALAALDLWGVMPLFPARPEALRGLLVGVAAAALALGWNAPLLGRSFGPAWSAGTGTGLAAGAAVVFALGLAAPFLLAAAAPGWTRPFARLTVGGQRGRGAGAEALAFLQVGGVLWLLYLLSAQVTSAGLAFIQATLLLAALAAWLLGSARRPVWTVIGAVLLLLAVLGVLRLADDHRRADTGNSGTVPAYTKTADSTITPTFETERTTLTR